jgi:hypothetical protein
VCALMISACAVVHAALGVCQPARAPFALVEPGVWRAPLATLPMIPQATSAATAPTRAYEAPTGSAAAWVCICCAPSAKAPQLMLALMLQRVAAAWAGLDCGGGENKLYI